MLFRSVLYVTKSKVGTDYVLSTNTDIYEYDLTSKKTTNLTEGMMGYDTNPQYSKEGVLAWLSMAHMMVMKLIKTTFIY